MIPKSAKKTTSLPRSGHFKILPLVHGIHHTEYDTGVYEWHHVTMATNRGNEERFERISYSGYKMSSDKDIALFLNER